MILDIVDVRRLALCRSAPKACRGPYQGPRSGRVEERAAGAAPADRSRDHDVLSDGTSSQPQDGTRECPFKGFVQARDPADRLDRSRRGPSYVVLHWPGPLNDGRPASVDVDLDREVVSKDLKNDPPNREISGRCSCVRRASAGNQPGSAPASTSFASSPVTVLLTDSAMCHTAMIARSAETSTVVGTGPSARVRAGRLASLVSR